MKAAVLRVSDGRGFVVERRGCLNREERIVITAAHCLAYSRLANGVKGFPPSHPGSIWRRRPIGTCLAG